MTPDLREALVRFAASPRVLVALDFDGTISHLVPVPGAARPVPGALAQLERLSRAPATDIALVSGRARADLAGVSGAAELALLVGSHGQEVGSDVALAADEHQLLAALRAAVAAGPGTLPGVRVEDKPAGLAVHVRGSDPEVARAAVIAVEDIAAREPSVHCLEGKMVIELSVRPLDKGSALRMLIETDPGRSVLFAGDDVTDEAALRALRGQDVGIKVGSGPSGAQFRVPDPEGMVEVLALVGRLRESGPGD
jgi:trehalose 6-phosphate phosphatase